MIRVRGDRVLVALPPAEPEHVTASGLILVRDPDLAKLPTRGIVVQVGEKTGTVDLDDVLACVMDDDIGIGSNLDREDVYDALKRLAPAPFDVQVNDCVLFPLAAGEEVEIDGVTYVILHEAEILGVVEPLS